MNEEIFQRSGSSLDALNARIARLAIALDVQLDDAADMAKAMCHSQTFQIAHERRVASVDQISVNTPMTVDRRLANKREELRGLLVMRYEMETRYINDRGLAAARQMMHEGEDHLVRQGFKPGADGIVLDDFNDVK